MLHTLKVNELPEHVHRFSIYRNAPGDYSIPRYFGYLKSIDTWDDYSDWRYAYSGELTSKTQLPLGWTNSAGNNEKRYLKISYK